MNSLRLLVAAVMTDHCAVYDYSFTSLNALRHTVY